mmetsp:Transcript_58277/g.142481  ORF Transcript_58277/g.142481 Transcript_58277/m.142481 type:complete len:255 (-) Transcript_58277:471-1235(-)
MTSSRPCLDVRIRFTLNGDHTSSTSAPTASSCALSSSALSCFRSFWMTFGADSHISFASFNPRPAIVLTSLMTLIFALESKPTNFRSNIVFSSAASPASPSPPADAFVPVPAPAPPPPVMPCSASCQLTPSFSWMSCVNRWTSIISNNRIRSNNPSTLAFDSSDKGGGGVNAYSLSVTRTSSSLPSLESSGDSGLSSPPSVFLSPSSEDSVPELDAGASSLALLLSDSDFSCSLFFETLSVLSSSAERYKCVEE